MLMRISLKMLMRISLLAVAGLQMILRDETVGTNAVTSLDHSLFQTPAFVNILLQVLHSDPFQMFFLPFFAVEYLDS